MTAAAVVAVALYDSGETDSFVVRPESGDAFLLSGICGVLVYDAADRCVVVAKFFG